MMKHTMILWIGAFVLVAGMGCSGGAGGGPVVQFNYPTADTGTETVSENTATFVDLAVIPESWEQVPREEKSTSSQGSNEGSEYYSRKFNFTMKVENLFLDGNPGALEFDIYISRCCCSCCCC